ncbi:MAG: hypothetical protein ABIP94_08705 [Planctomycetota bacterium]
MNIFQTTLLAALATCCPTMAQRMITLDSSRSVHEVNITTAVKTLLGTVSANAATTGGFAYDIVTGRLFLSSTSLDSLYVVDVTNWNAKLIGAYGNSALVMHGLEWDPSTNTLYGMSSHDGGLYTISQTTGAATLVGLSGVTSFCNLVYHPFNNTMYMTNSGTDSFYSIDRATGLATLIGPLTGPTNPNGLAFNNDNGLVYLVDNNTDSLYTIDVTTGAATSIGSMGSGNTLGLVYIPGVGRLTRAVHGCGTTTITPTGHPQIGYTIDTTIGNVTGFPFVGFGLSSLGIAFCSCTVGHEWAVALLGPTVSFAIPPNPGVIGVQLQIQGLDFLGTGGCANPMLTLTDTITVTIG